MRFYVIFINSTRFIYKSENELFLKKADSKINILFKHIKTMPQIYLSLVHIYLVLFIILSPKSFLLFLSAEVMTNIVINNLKDIVIMGFFRMIYIYIYIYRERERESHVLCIYRQRITHLSTPISCHITTYAYIVLY